MEIPLLRKNVNKYIIIGVIAFLILVIVLIYLLFKMNSTTQPPVVEPLTQTITVSPTLTATTAVAPSINTNSYNFNITSKLSLNTIQMTGKGSQGLAIDPNTGYVYVGAFSGISNKCLQGNNTGTSYLDIVNPAAKKEIANTVSDFAPIWPAIDDQRGLVYLAASSVDIFKLNTGIKVGTYNVSGLPHMPVVLGNIMVVSNTYNQTEQYYSAINLDTGQIIGNYSGPSLPHPIVVLPDQKVAYMMGVESGEVQEIDMTTGKPITTFTLEKGAGQLAISEKYNLIITDANNSGNSLSFYDLTTHRYISSIGFSGLGTPGTVQAVDDKDGLVFIVISDGNAIGVASLQTLKPLGYFTVGGCPYGVRIDSQRQKGYVTNSGDGTLTQFDLNDIMKALAD